MLLPRVSLRFALGYVLLPFQGVLSPKHHITQGVASLALGYVLLPFQGVPFNRKVRFFLRTKLMA